LNGFHDGIVDSLLLTELFGGIKYPLCIFVGSVTF